MKHLRTPILGLMVIVALGLCLATLARAQTKPTTPPATTAPGATAPPATAPGTTPPATTPGAQPAPGTPPGALPGTPTPPGTVPGQDGTPPTPPQTPGTTPAPTPPAPPTFREMAENLGMLMTVPEVWEQLPRFGLSTFAFPVPEGPQAVVGGAAATATATPQVGTTAAPKPPAAPGATPATGVAPIPGGMESQPPASSAIPAYYPLGPGDELTVRCWSDGLEHLAQKVIVSTDGKLYLPLVGEVLVEGDTLGTATTKITVALREFYPKSQVSVEVTRPRVVEVYVIGDVRRPGKYPLPGMATVFTALYAAGGPSEIGSLRRVRLLPLQGEAKEIDLYAYLLSGERVTQQTLSVGDTVFVGTREMEIGVVGEVHRSGRYEIKPGVSCADALKMAGGPTSMAYTRNLQVWRVAGGEKRTVVSVALDGARDLKLQDGDLVVVKPIIEDDLEAVRIEGAVRRPGVFGLTPNMRVADLLRKAQGPADDAHLGKALVWRLNETLHLDVLTFDVAKALAGNETDNLPLRPRDRVVVRNQAEAERSQMVNIAGEVKKPGDYAWGRGMKISDLIAAAGGIEPSAYGERALLWRLNEALDYGLTSFALNEVMAAKVGSDQTLEPQDRVLILSKTDARQPDSVNVTGAVRVPREYDWGPGMHVSDLIMRAGGLTTAAYGRQATLLRFRETDGAQEIMQIRLSEALRGQKEADLELQRGDVLRVMGKDEVDERSEVWIGGLVKHPGAYPRYENMKISDLIFAAGGLSPGASGEIIYSRGRVVGEPQITEAKVTNMDTDRLKVEPDVALQDDDHVAVRGLGGFIRRPPFVRLEGRVAKPGVYSVPASPDQKRTVYDIITEAGGLLPDANAAGILLFRPKSELWLNRGNVLQKVLDQFNRTITTPAPGAEATGPVTPSQLVAPGEGTDAALTGATGATAGATAPTAPGGTAGGTTPAPGTTKPGTAPTTKTESALTDEITAQFTRTASGEQRLGVVIPPRQLDTRSLVDIVPVDGEQLMATKGKQGDAIVMDDDVVIVQRLVSTVAVLGSVAQSGEIAFMPGETAAKAILRVGGTTEDADFKSATVLRVNGTAVPASRAGDLKPGDIVVVPSKYLMKVEEPRAPFFDRLWQGLTQGLALYGLLK